MKNPFLTNSVWDYCPYCSRPFHVWRVPLWMWNGLFDTIVRCGDCMGKGNVSGEPCHTCYTNGYIEIHHPLKKVSIGTLAVKFRWRHVNKCAIINNGVFAFEKDRK